MVVPPIIIVVSARLNASRAAWNRATGSPTCPPAYRCCHVRPLLTARRPVAPFAVILARRPRARPAARAIVLQARHGSSGWADDSRALPDHRPRRDRDRDSRHRDRGTGSIGPLPRWANGICSGVETWIRLRRHDHLPRGICVDRRLRRARATHQDNDRRPRERPQTWGRADEERQQARARSGKRARPGPLWRTSDACRPGTGGRHRRDLRHHRHGVQKAVDHVRAAGDSLRAGANNKEIRRRSKFIGLHVAQGGPRHARPPDAQHRAGF
jgi:hypothetical protein